MRQATCAAILYALLLSTSATADDANDFDRLELRLVGTAFFQGEASALVEIRSTGQRKFFEPDEALEGFTVAGIQADKVVFKRGGHDFSLYINQETTKKVIQTYEARIAKAEPNPSRTYSKPHMALASLRSSGAMPVFEPPLWGRVASGFGQRQDPMGGGKKFHYGIDISCSSGSKIGAAAEGTVASVGWRAYLGYFVEINHKKGYKTVYGHLSKLLVKEGRQVSLGDTIGLSGATGRVTGPHLHFEVRRNGIAVDPATFVPNLRRR